MGVLSFVVYIYVAQSLGINFLNQISFASKTPLVFPSTEYLTATYNPDAHEILLVFEEHSFRIDMNDYSVEQRPYSIPPDIYLKFGYNTFSKHYMAWSGGGGFYFEKESFHQDFVRKDKSFDHRNMYYHASFVHPMNKALSLFGGYGFWQNKNTIIYFNNLKSEWDLLSYDLESELPLPRRSSATFVDYSTNQLYVMGGNGQDDSGQRYSKQFLNDVWSLDLERGIWSQLGELSIDTNPQKNKGNDFQQSFSDTPVAYSSEKDLFVGWMQHYSQGFPSSFIIGKTKNFKVVPVAMEFSLFYTTKFLLAFYNEVTGNFNLVAAMGNTNLQEYQLVLFELDASILAEILQKEPSVFTPASLAHLLSNWHYYFSFLFVSLFGIFKFFKLRKSGNDSPSSSSNEANSAKSSGEKEHLGSPGDDESSVIQVEEAEEESEHIQDSPNQVQSSSEQLSSHKKITIQQVKDDFLINGISLKEQQFKSEEIQIFGLLVPTLIPEADGVTGEDISHVFPKDFTEEYLRKRRHLTFENLDKFFVTQCNAPSKKWIQYSKLTEDKRVAVYRLNPECFYQLSAFGGQPSA